MNYRFCPNCGKRLTLRPAGDDGQVPYCEACERYWFATFPSCVIVLVANEQQELALIHQSYLSDRFDVFVSGFIAPGESAEETAVREVQEELGLEVQQLISTGTFWYPDAGQLMHGFIAYAKKAPLSLSDELDGAGWVPAAEAHRTLFPVTASPPAYAIYETYLKNENLKKKE